MTENKRRARGEGGVYWDDARQRWIAQKTVGYDGRGKRIVRKGTGTSRTAALRALDKRVKAYQAGLTVRSEHYTVRQAVEDWLDHGQGDIDESTQKRNRIMCETHIVPKVGGRKLQQLRPDEIDAWLKQLSEILASSYLARLHGVLSSAVRRAMRRGFVDRNVVDLCDVPRGQEGRRSKSLTMEQARAVIANTTEDPLHCYIVISLLTGARTEELRALRWENVHLDAEPPHVEVWRSVRRTGDTKTKKSRRTLALSGLATERLREHRTRQAAARLRAESWADPGLVFATSTGTQMDAANVRRDFRRALRSVPGLTPQDWTPRELRHSFVSLLSASGLGIEDIAGLVGHQGTRVTEQVYRHELRPIIQTGATAMDTLFEWPVREKKSDG
ncbi:MAG: site-specific integrase [Nocardioides sp.]|nr:site-specific integrase [Nocardioides sp.]